LPNGGGYPIIGLYDLDPSKRGLVDNYSTFARNLGGDPKSVYAADC